MIGRAFSTNPGERGEQLQKDLPGTIAGSVQYASNVARPWIVTEGARGIRATVDDHGRGLLAVSKNWSEVNIYNYNPRLVTQQSPPPQNPGLTNKLLSRNIPQ